VSPRARAPGPTDQLTRATAASAQVKATLPPDHKVTDVMKATGEMWRVADEATKAVYKQLADDDKARYAAELEHYDGPLKVRPAHPPLSRGPQYHPRP
jgi:hypothetical protein